MILLLLAPGCSFEAHGGLLDSGTDPQHVEDSDAPEDEDTELEDTGEAPDPLDVDDDGDGLSEREGDCNDDDDSIYPGAWDGCDGINHGRRWAPRPPQHTHSRTSTSCSPSGAGLPSDAASPALRAARRTPPRPVPARPFLSPQRPRWRARTAAATAALRRASITNINSRRQGWGK